MGIRRVIRLDKPAGDIGRVIDTIKFWYDSAGSGSYKITMEKIKDARTTSQNNLMWLWFTAIAQEWSESSDKPITPQNVHDVYCEMFLPIDTPKGTVGGSTRELSTDEMAMFLDKVQADASTEYGIRLPNPDDYNFELWKAQYMN